MMWAGTPATLRTPQVVRCGTPGTLIGSRPTAGARSTLRIHEPMQRFFVCTAASEMSFSR
jgi:hypothetical protein